LNGGGVEDRLPAIARAEKRDGVAAGKHRERRNGVQRGHDRLELVSRSLHAAGHARERIIYGA